MTESEPEAILSLGLVWKSILGVLGNAAWG